jgi:hypothetical protein
MDSKMKEVWMRNRPAVGRICSDGKKCGPKLLRGEGPGSWIDRAAYHLRAQGSVRAKSELPH